MVDRRDSRRSGILRDTRIPDQVCLESQALDQLSERERERERGIEAFDLRDFDAHVEDAKQEAEAAQLALSMTQILGAVHEVKAALQRVDVVSATREKNEAERAAALARLQVSASELAQAARAGAHAGSAAALADVIQRVDFAAQMVRTVNERLDRDARRREGERDLWVQATMYAAICGAIAILAGVGGGYIIGKDAGSASGYATARDEVAAASWGNTANGSFARQLDRDGTLQQMRDCSGEQWRLQEIQRRRVCFAGLPSNKGQLQGWYVP